MKTQIPLSKKEILIISLIASAKFLLHFFTNAFVAYGYFRDELYYIACSDHLDWGYVDHPPLSIYLLKISRFILGDSLVGLRVFPALAGSFTIVLTGLIAKRLGGKSFAITIACLATFTALIQLAMNGFYNMNSYDILIWVWAAYIIVKIINTKEPKLWIVLGLILGAGLLNKISVLFLGAGIFVAFLLSEERTWFKTKWPYLAGIIALCIFLPYIIWNINHNFAHLEFAKNASEGKYSSLTPTRFLVDQLLINNPLNVPIWISGLLALLFFKPFKDYSPHAIIYFVAFFILIGRGTAKAEYLAPAYAMLFAAGAAFIELRLSAPKWNWLRYTFPPLMVVHGAIFTPFVIPILPVEKYIPYADKIGIGPSTTENIDLAELPQFYADMFGWEEKAKAVYQVYNSLSPAEKVKCAIFSNNYGRCGAIDFFGEKYGLPKSIGIHNNYWIWGPRNYTGEIVIVIGGSLEDHEGDFESCKLASKLKCKYFIPYENNLNIFLCRNLKGGFKRIWKDEKHFQ